MGEGGTCFGSMSRKFPFYIKEFAGDVLAQLWILLGNLHDGICLVGWVDIGTRTKVPLRFVTYLSKVTKIDEKSVLVH
jgi:hypothetical protein